MQLFENVMSTLSIILLFSNRSNLYLKLFLYTYYDCLLNIKNVIVLLLVLVVYNCKNVMLHYSDYNPQRLCNCGGSAVSAE